MSREPTAPAPLGWLGIVRLGLVQAAIGAVVMLATSLLNRVMVVELALPAAVPAGLVAWHYAVQLTRPLWGHGSDRGGRRTRWILAGMAVLGCGALLAVAAIAIYPDRPITGALAAISAFTMIGGGVGAAGTSLLALLAARVTTGRQQAAAAITWTMMVAGIAITAGVAGAMIEPFSLARLAKVAGGIAPTAFLLTAAALWRIEARVPAKTPAPQATSGGFGEAVRAALADAVTRRFTAFVFCSMLAYSMQDLILEPFAGLLFRYTPGASTQLSGIQHGGVLAGMLLAGVAGNAFRGVPQRAWIVGGCLLSGLALVGLAIAARYAPAWPLALNVAGLGFGNGVFAVSAVGAMIGLAARDESGRSGLLLGVWGAAQAVAFGLGGLAGAVAVDAMRGLIGSTAQAYTLTFAAEALLFLVAARLGAAAAPARDPERSPVVMALA